MSPGFGYATFQPPVLFRGVLFSGVMKREFTGVFIPAHIWTSKLLPAEKMLLGEISALSTKTGWCDASRAHFAEWLHCDPTNVTHFIKKLENLGYLEVSRMPGYRSKMRVKIDAFYVGVVNENAGGVVNPIHGGSEPHSRVVVNPIHGGSEPHSPEIKDKYNNKRKEESENAPAQNEFSTLEAETSKAPPVPAPPPSGPHIRDFVDADTPSQMIERIHAFYATEPGQREKEAIYANTLAGKMSDAQRTDVVQRFAAWAVRENYGQRTFRELNSQFFTWWKNQTRFQQPAPGAPAHQNSRSEGPAMRSTDTNPYARHKIIS
jgi:hypothetical protein